MDMNYLDVVGKRIRDRVPRSEIPNERDTDLLFRIYAVLLLAKGLQVTTEDVHNAWVAWMSEIDPTHASLIPFGDLDASTAADDEPYVVAIKSVVADEETHK
uniref:DUF7701 domain-containing protein n=1 Tax=Mycolicibacterium septicum TaxID=98668 RepID=UPI001B34CB70|nr:hypothetical protein [Mycolicibacterium septicum]